VKAMGSFSKLIGVILIVFGILSLSYSGFTYSSQDKVAELGPVKITAETAHTIPFSPIAGGICLVAGIAMLIFDRIKR
jgi:hypothetical protein